MADRALQLAEDRRPGMRLGRHVKHDPRSLRYKVEPTGIAQTKIWDRVTPILDQGDLGSCTGNATVGVLGTSPFYGSLSTAQQQSLDEAQAVRVYSLATQLDDFDGTYPPDDTGSDGLDAAKAATQLGFISGYQHITSIAAAQTAILAGPFIVGTNWLAGMDEPDSSGVVHAKGAVRGGHEYECFGYDHEKELWWFCNSWGTSWGKSGTFAYSTADFAKLLAAQGDVTTFVPITQPAPTPTPEPVTPTPGPDAFPSAEYESLRTDLLAFVAHQFSDGKRRALVSEAPKFVAAMDAYLGRAE